MMKINIINLVIIMIIVLVLLYCLENKESFTLNKEQFDTSTTFQDYIPINYNFDRKSINMKSQMPNLIKVIQNSKDYLNKEIQPYNADGLGKSIVNTINFNIQSLPTIRNIVEISEVKTYIEGIIVVINKLANNNFILKYNSLKPSYKSETELQKKYDLTMNCDYYLLDDNKQYIFIEKIDLYSEIICNMILSDDIIRNPTIDESCYISVLNVKNLENEFYLNGYNEGDMTKYRYFNGSDPLYTFDDESYFDITGQEPNIAEYEKVFYGP